MNLARRATILLCTSLCTSFCTIAAIAAPAAQPYPSRPITLMVPYPAGGISDSIARAISAPLGKALGQQVIVDNLGGVSGALAAQKVLNAPADGYMLFQSSPNEVILSPLINAAVKLRAEDFRLLTLLTINPLVMVARKDLPANSIDEVVALGKSAGSKGLSYGSVGIGSMYHLVTESMAQQTGMQVTHVPYKGMAPLVQDIGGGNVDFAILPYATSLRGMADQGRLKLVGWIGDQRSKLDSTIPASGEGKALKNFNHETWAGIMIRKGTPEGVAVRLHKALAEIMQDAEVRRALEAVGTEVSRTSTLDQANKLLEAETIKFRAMAKSVNLQPQ